MRRAPVRRPGGVVASGVAAGVVVAGLTGTVALAALVGSPGTVDATTAPAAAAPVLQGAGADIANDVAARPDVETLACRRDGGQHWRVRARATNPTGHPVSYRLALRIAGTDGDVVGRAAVETAVVPARGATELRTRVPVSRVVEKASCIFVAIDRVNTTG
ncbi:hypothetical protein EKO23_03935 [Nocardioides guangzhouensis]|uniref:Uncharacterized protein n=1 Tax=Nocardioides guangzhouensis TaxID=2497878 RepID=A0A4Q4ZIE8_9ACTN|nr:hypothetical protein [Nocardioides guangzhouensis]RYP88010.1 hypothetical protein EKO23_03935 [Nocardioides guangzhouensis]